MGTAGTSGASPPPFCAALDCTADDANDIQWMNLGLMSDVDNKNQAKGTHQMCRDDFSNYVLPHLSGVAEMLSWHPRPTKA